MSERVEHAGYVGVLSNIDGEYLITWRPKDPMWRTSADTADVETVTSTLYSEAIAEWKDAVEVYIDCYRDDGRGNLAR